MSAQPAAVADRFSHQQGMLDFALNRPGAIWDAGMSAGKTYCYLKLAELIDAQIVIALCPRNVLGVFPREARKAADRDGREYATWNGHVEGARGPLANPTVAQRAVALVDHHKYALITRKPFLVAVNYDAAYRTDMARVLIAIARSARTLLILDESHKIKAPGGRASRFAQQLGAAVRANDGKVAAGSGTVAPHSPLDLYAQLRATDPSILGTNFARVKARYGRPKVAYTMTEACPACFASSGATTYGGPTCATCGGDGQIRTDVAMTGPKGEPIYDGILEERAAEYAERVARGIYRVDQETIDRNLGLDEPVDLYRTIDLTPRVRRIYDRLERDLVAQLDNGTVASANSMVNTMRLAQVASGYAPDADDPDHTHELSRPPELYRLLVETLDEISTADPVVVFARFRNDLRWVQQAAHDVGRRYGELSGSRRDGLTADAEMSPVVDLLGVQIQAGESGIDLTRSHHGIYYSLGFNLGDYQQSRRRLQREGQKHVVTFVHLMAENTIHEAIYGALRKRERVNTAFLNRVKELSP